MTSSFPKSEPVETSSSSDFNPVDLERDLVQILSQYPKGTSNDVLHRAFPSVTANQLLSALNRLLSATKVELLKSSSTPGGLLYRLRDNTLGSSSSISTGSSAVTDQMERAVYQLVRESGNRGIWTRDIRQQTRASQTILNKTLKSLESKKIIKAVKSVHANKRKVRRRISYRIYVFKLEQTNIFLQVYMLYELTPDPTITGGTWYSDHEFEAEFVRVLNEQCARLLDERFVESEKKFPNDPFARRNSSFMSAADLVNLINDMGIATVSLTTQDIESILYTLICDGKVEKTTVGQTSNSADGSAKQNLYRAVKAMSESSPIIRNPCGICPVFKDCHDDGLITPKSCAYLNAWLEF